MRNLVRLLGLQRKINTLLPIALTMFLRSGHSINILGVGILLLIQRIKLLFCDRQTSID
jgi:hypothetical protein